MRAARKCGLTRRMRSTRFSSVRSRRPLRNLLQNPLKQQVPLVSAVVAKAVLIQVGLQILRAHIVVDAPDSTLHQTPESFDGLSVNVARDINLRAVPDALVNVALRLQTVTGHKVIGKDGARWQDVFLRQTVKSFL